MKTPRINLLPYREARIKAIKIRFLSFIGGAFAIGALIMGGVHSIYSMQLNTQNDRNRRLEEDIKNLDKEISQIKQLREQIQAAVARKQVVESLQANRTRSVMLFNQIVQPPANIFWRSIRQTGESITFSGIAPSNTSVSTLLRILNEGSDIVFDAKLVESKAVSIAGTPMTEFNITAKVVNLAKVMTDKNKMNAKSPMAKPAQQEQPKEQPKDPNLIKAPTAQQPAQPQAVPLQPESKQAAQPQTTAPETNKTEGKK